MTRWFHREIFQSNFVAISQVRSLFQFFSRLPRFSSVHPDVLYPNDSGVAVPHNCDCCGFWVDDISNFLLLYLPENRCAEIFIIEAVCRRFSGTEVKFNIVHQVSSKNNRVRQVSNIKILAQK